MSYRRNFVLNMMDPLVKLNDELEPEAALAQSWDLSDEGKAVTFHLRQDGRWTNGDPVTAADFEYAWKRVLDPELASEYAYQLYGIAGAKEYNGCDPDEARLRGASGQGAGERRRREDARSPVDEFAAVVHSSVGGEHRFFPCTERQWSSSVESGRSRGTSSRTGRTA